MRCHELESLSPGAWFYDVKDQLKRHVYDRSLRAFAAGDLDRDGITTREALQARQRAIRETLVQSLGGLPAMDSSLNAQKVGTVEGRGFRIEKIIFESRPSHFVTANLYVPDAVTSRSAAVQFLCGHHRDAKHQPEYQAVCQVLVSAGLIVLAQDPPGQGERFGYYEPSLGESTVGWGTTEHDTVGAQCLVLGDALGRYFLHDAMRGIDYLCSRPEVDPERIGIVGNSGGGTQCSLMMMADPRIAAAVPATFLTSREAYLLAGGAQDAEQIWPGFSAAGFDHEDVVLAMAPRPVRLLAVNGDFFPIEGTRRTVERCKRFWDICGAPGELDLVEDEGGHRFTLPLARAAAEFFSRHLLGRTCSSLPEPEPLEPSSLWCTRSGQVRGEVNRAAFVFEENQERLKQLTKERFSRTTAGRRDDAERWLRHRVLNGRRPCQLNPRFYFQGQLDELKVESAFWWSQEGLFSHAHLLRHFEADGERLPVTIALWDGGATRVKPHLDWIRSTTASGRAVMVLDVSGVGALQPHSITGAAPDALYGVIHKLSTDLIFLDDDLAALRTFDVLRSLEMLAAWPGLEPRGVHIYARGLQGLYGRLAAFLDSRIQHVDVAGGLESYSDWVSRREYDTSDIYSVILRGVLQHFDLNELDGA